jgi:hypothetical protein
MKNFGDIKMHGATIKKKDKDVYIWRVGFCFGVTVRRFCNLKWI